MTRQEHLQFCKKCTNRKMDVDRGLICNLTGEVADFEDSCESFERDESVKDEIVDTEAQSTTEAIAQLPADIKDKLLPHQDLLYAIIGGFFLSIICGLIWAVITVTTEYQIGYMAIGVGLAVGMGVRYFGAGIDLVYGIVGALFSLIGCLLGNLFSQVGFIAQAEMLGYFQTLMLLDLGTIRLIFEDTFSPMDLVFYGIAVYEGYRFAFRSIPADFKERNDFTPAYSNMRLPLVIVCFAVITLTGYTLSRGANGNQTYYHENGKVMATGQLVNGKEEGTWDYFYETGKPQAKATYLNGIENGDWTWYYESGEVMRTGQYVNGITNGVWLNYFEDGQLSDSSTHRLGRLDGRHKSFFPNGKLVQEGQYARDLKTGPWRIYNGNGTMAGSGDFEKDVPLGVWKFWDVSGNRQSEREYLGEDQMLITNAWDNSGKQTVLDGNGTFSNYYESGELMEYGKVSQGKRTGVWISYYESSKKKEEGYYKHNTYFISMAWSEGGDLQVKDGAGQYETFFEGTTLTAEKGEFTNGRKVGYWETYHPNSIVILQENNFLDGELDGKSVTYFANGQIANKGSFKDGERNGDWTWYYESGYTQCTVTYKEGKKQGSQLFWSESGQRAKEEVYEDGELVSEILLESGVD